MIGKGKAVGGAPKSAKAKPATKKGGKGDEKQFDAFKEALKLASSGKAFEDPSGCAFIRFEQPSAETFDLSGAAFGKWLRRAFHAKHGRTLNTRELEGVRAEMVARAGGEKAEVALRVGESGGDIYIDLGDTARRTARLSAGGVTFTNKAPVNFLRPATFKPLPAPRVQRAGARGEALATLLGRLLPDFDEAAIAVAGAFLIGSMGPGGPYMPLQLLGPQGSGKSTFLKMLKRLLDPAALEARTLPSCERDLMIAARNSHVLAFDNVSKIYPAMSDALCKLATGGGIGLRELYSNSGEMVFNAVRPVILNGIGDVVTRPDLKERTLVLQMPEITRRRSEKEIWLKFEALAPEIVGSLFDCVARGLVAVAEPEPEQLPRMADWYLFVRRAFPHAGFANGLLEDILAENTRWAHGSALEASPVAQAVLMFMAKRDGFEGTATNLRDHLGIHQKDFCDATVWPSCPATLAAELRRAEPTLLAAGVRVKFGRTSGERTIRIDDLRGKDGSRQMTG